ncbi:MULTISPECIES: Na+/H+ antiporter subunit E [unclassified Exiguobacterium]|uniref:Na+/H+ antiporter subunit E n=1 Tax=unclassified Exiguobacterium TaxID=2644629 RepID=UPI00103E7261|nr:MULTISPECIES: Na+/H+ antiporter subunit E [unclassified Exiguobacterium]TCI69646.1 Na+/H+ antiporter subunit E [Exiguobacterium sp. IPCI3]TCI78943.1 Na+/H+ antiporter subunit E [Exiguobacterium sp. IPCH1]TCI81530.1 Na+/H+ antiporter subunit E [Exiguobacterium sp. IPBC4]
MTFQIVLNTAIAILWAVLWNSYTGVDFLLGYLVGVFILYVLRHFLHFDFYMRRVIAAFKLLALFIKELILSNIDVVKVLLSPKFEIEPGIIEVSTELKSGWELTLLVSLISLTPGTIVMDFSEDNKSLFVHSIHVPDKEEMIREIHETFEKAIMEVTH